MFKLQKRFWKKVKTTNNIDDCWEWNSQLNDAGYGKFFISKSETVLAHRFIFSLYNGPIPKGLFICHKCDNPPCCNPNHLFQGTPKDNSMDMMNKGRNITKRGEDHPNTIFSDQFIHNILQELETSNFDNLKQITKKYNISLSWISKLLRGNIRTSSTNCNMDDLRSKFFSRYRYIILTPDNKLYDVFNLKLFCKLNNLSYTGMWRVSNFERSDYKGFKCCHYEYYINWSKEQNLYDIIINQLETFTDVNSFRR